MQSAQWRRGGRERIPSLDEPVGASVDENDGREGKGRDAGRRGDYAAKRLDHGDGSGISSRVRDRGSNVVYVDAGSVGSDGKEPRRVAGCPSGLWSGKRWFGEVQRMACYECVGLRELEVGAIPCFGIGMGFGWAVTVFG